MRTKTGLNLADEAFWAQDDDCLQLRSPWVFREWQEARDALFVEALALHRAFIDAAAKPLRHNLRAAIEVLKGRVLKEQQETLRGAHSGPACFLSSQWCPPRSHRRHGCLDRSEANSSAGS